MKNSLSNLCILIGLSLLIWSGLLFYIRNYSNILAFEKPPQTQIIEKDVTPRKLFIPAINKTLDIFPAIATNLKWETTSKGVSYLSSSPIPGTSGNSVMYGHNWNTILGNLYELVPGDQLIIKMSNGENRIFIVENTAVVNPTRISVIENTNDIRLTLYTCTGFLDSKRLIVVAKLLDP